MNKLNLLLLVVALNVALVGLGAHAGFGDLFKKKDKPGENAGGESEQADARNIAKVGAAPGAPGRSRPRANLDEVRAAKEEQDRLAAEAAAAAEMAAPKYPKRHGYQTPTGGSKMVQGRRRHLHREPEVPEPQYEDEEDEAGDDDHDEYDQAMAAYRKQQGGGAGPEAPSAEGAESGLMGRITNKNVREQLAAKFVSTHKGGNGGAGVAGPKINNVRRVKKQPGDGADEPKKSSYWGNKFGKALKVTKKGIKKGATAIAELPKYMEQAADSVNALLKLDGKGKLLALIDQVKGDIHFVRKEFSQFTLNWSPPMEKALDYLGDTGLDKIKWNDRDELDLKKDALHSLVLGYEFMRLMVAWRENLLIAHESYKLWLESLKSQYEQKHFDVDEDLLMQLSTIHSYLLLSAWEEIDERAFETRLKLDHLMEIEDDRPKNYESEYFRNIIVLQEMYYPTVEELDEERAQVQESISTSGVVVDNLEQVTEFYENFRKSVETDEMTDVDCKVPRELYQFLDKLQPQLESTPLVFTKDFIKDLRQARVERQAEKAQQAGH